MDAHKDPDPDPKKIGPDPQHCWKLRDFLNCFWSRIKTTTFLTISVSKPEKIWKLYLFVLTLLKREKKIIICVYF